MAKFLIEGGKTLQGEIIVNAGKNAPVALLCAALLVRGKVVFRDMTRGQEVERMLEILESIGVGVLWEETDVLALDTSGDLDMDSIDRHACEVTRASILLCGALAARQKHFKIYKSGGCKLGNRTIRPHTLALKKLGVDIVSHDDCYEIQAKRPRGAEVVMYESGDTATENTIMAAVLAEGETQIRFASANYMVQDICYFLQAAGADIEGIGTTTLRIRGVPSLNTSVSYSVTPIRSTRWPGFLLRSQQGLG